MASIYFLGWTLGHERYPEVTLSAVTDVTDAEELAARGLLTLTYLPDLTVRPALTDAGRALLRRVSSEEDFEWMTEHCGCLKPHRP